MFAGASGPRLYGMAPRPLNKSCACKISCILQWGEVRLKLFFSNELSLDRQNQRTARMGNVHVNSMVLRIAHHLVNPPVVT